MQPATAHAARVPRKRCFSPGQQRFGAKRTQYKDKQDRHRGQGVAKTKPWGPHVGLRPQRARLFRQRNSSSKDFLPGCCPGFRQEWKQHWLLLRKEKAASARSGRTEAFVNTIIFLERGLAAWFLALDRPGLNPSSHFRISCDNLSEYGFHICEMEINKTYFRGFLGRYGDNPHKVLCTVTDTQ